MRTTTRRCTDGPGVDAEVGASGARVAPRDARPGGAGNQREPRGRPGDDPGHGVGNSATLVGATDSPPHLREGRWVTSTPSTRRRAAFARPPSASWPETGRPGPPRNR